MDKQVTIPSHRYLAALSGILFSVVAGQAAMAQSAADPDLVEKGRGVATAADCMACHTVPHTGKPFAGGYPIVSPLGTIYSTNITPSKTAGIGSYSETDFDQAVRHGIRKDGSHLYPAMPYDAYGQISDDDLHALYAYFQNGVAPVDDKPRNLTALPFPFNVRFSMTFWNLLYADTSPFKANSATLPDVERGRYIADALGHCGTCHSPRNVLMGVSKNSYLSGGFVGPWYAPNITSDAVSGIGGWSTDELVQYFKTGHVNGKNQAAAGMAEAVENSLQFLPQQDLVALATYLKTVPAIRDPADNHPTFDVGGPVSHESAIRGIYAPNEHDSLRNGEQLYSGNCASCHGADGAGSENQAYPSLFHNTATGSSQPANLVAAILYGVEREAAGKQVLMPNFGKNSFVNPLDDQQIVDISNYVLESFGKAAIQVSLADVAAARNGGPSTFLAEVQPFIIPLIWAAVVLIILATVAILLLRRRGKARVGLAN
jgi:fructose 5-dehydrogenase cytochrome subunit